MKNCIPQTMECYNVQNSRSEAQLYILPYLPAAIKKAITHKDHCLGVRHPIKWCIRLLQCRHNRSAVELHILPYRTATILKLWKGKNTKGRSLGVQHSM